MDVQTGADVMTPKIYKLVWSFVAAGALTSGCASAQIRDAGQPGEHGGVAGDPQETPPEVAPSVPPDVAAQPADPQVVELLQKIEAVSSELNTLKARVRYTRIQTLTGDQQRRYGDFYYATATQESPTQFAVLFDRIIVDDKARPMQAWYIFDGNWLLERDHDDKSAVRRELVPKGAEKSDTLSLGDGQMPIPLRLKADEVLKTYQVTQLDDEPYGEEQVLIHLQLKPKQAKQAGAPLDLWFDKKTLSLHKVVTTEDTDEIEMLFTQITPNPTIKAETFDTKLPDTKEGWQVQEVGL